MRYLVPIIACVFMIANWSGLANAEERYGKQKVVYHINYNGGDKDKRYRGAMRNIQNHINAVGADNMEIKVVLHGNGLGVLKSAKSNELLQGQVASACAAARRSSTELGPRGGAGMLQLPPRYSPMVFNQRSVSRCR